MVFSFLVKIIDRLEFFFTKRAFYMFGINNRIGILTKFNKKALIEIGNNNIIGSNSFFYAIEEGNNKIHPKIKLGSNIYIGHNVNIHSIGEIVINDYVVFSDYVYVSNVSHGLELIEGESIMKQDWKYSGKVIIGEGTFVGHGVKILPNIELGKYCIVGAGSVVTKSFEDYSVIAGNPAKLLKMRK